MTVWPVCSSPDCMSDTRRSFFRKAGLVVAAAVLGTAGLGHVSARAADPVPSGPSGNYSLVWSDEFNGTSLDTSKWYAWDNGTTRNGTPMYASNVSESGGNLHLNLSSSSSGASIVSANQFGDNPAPPNGYRMKVGDVVEARILFPAASNGQVANWPSIWFFGGPNTSAPGEIDLFEGLGGSATSNYHPPSGAATINNYPPGSWAGSWHTYTVVRNATSFDAYVDGQHFLTQPTSDDGSPMSVILVNGAGQYGGPVTPGADMQVDYVRAWSPSSSPAPSPSPTSPSPSPTTTSPSPSPSPTSPSPTPTVARVKVPYVKGDRASTALTIIRNAGFQAVTSPPLLRDSRYVATGTSPAAGTLAPKGSLVTIYVKRAWY